MNMTSSTTFQNYPIIEYRAILLFFFYKKFKNLEEGNHFLPNDVPNAHMVITHKVKNLMMLQIFCVFLPSLCVLFKLLHPRR